MITNVDWVSFGTLNIVQGDMLFVRSPTPPETGDIERLRAMFPFDVTIIFVDANVDIAKWTKDRILPIPVEVIP